jgi:prolyl-tRNA synthetase
LERTGLKEKTNVLMGCYGIGVSRLMQATIECNQTENHYPNWPLEIAPFQIGNNINWIMDNRQEFFFQIEKNKLQINFTFI